MRAEEKLLRPMAVRMPMIAITTRSSRRVKAFLVVISSLYSGGRRDASVLELRLHIGYPGGSGQAPLICVGFYGFLGSGAGRSSWISGAGNRVGFYSNATNSTCSSTGIVARTSTTPKSSYVI